MTSQPPETNRAEWKIEAFRRLKPGWRYGEGVASQPEASANAMALVRHAKERGFVEMNAFPGAGGEVVVTLYNDDMCWEFTFDGIRCDYRKERGNNKVCEDCDIMPKKALRYVEDIRGNVIPFRNTP